MSTNLVASPRAYQQSAILTASPEQLVVMLYDGANRFLFQSATAMRSGKVELTHSKLRRAEDIIDHLRNTLDFEQGGQISVQLNAIYLFCLRHLNKARVERDPAAIEKVQQLLGELREAWANVARGSAQVLDPVS